MQNATNELLGPSELAARIGYSVSGVRKLERLGVIPQALRMAGTGHRCWRGEDVALIREAISKRRAAQSVTRAAA